MAPSPSGPLKWPGLRTEYAWLHPHEGATVTGSSQIGVSFTHHSGLVQEHAGKEREIDVAAGATFVTGVDSIAWLRVREHTEALEIYPDIGFLARIADTSPSRISITPSLGPPDPIVLAVASTFRRAHAADAYISDIAASELSVRLGTRLIDRYTGAGIPRDRFHGRLDERRLQRVVSFIDSSLSDTLDISSLADVAALSPAHFSRAFRRTTGVAPHQFVTMLRMSRAKNMLVSSDETVADIAGKVGFANLSHFRRLFRSHFGLAPADIRR